MKKTFIMICIPLIIACKNKVNSQTEGKEKSINSSIVMLKSSFVLEDKNLLKFIDEYIELYQQIGLTEKSDLNNNFYLLYIYQNDFFTRIKLTFIPPYENLLKHACMGTGYFEYKGRIFIIITGLEGLCARDSSLQKELMTKFADRIKPTELIEFPFTFTCEADIVCDTLFIKHRTINPMSAPPADTAELFKYMRSIKSFTY